MKNLGICNKCKETVPIKHFQKDGKEYLEKDCPKCETAACSKCEKDCPKCEKACPKGDACLKQDTCEKRAACPNKDTCSKKTE